MRETMGVSANGLTIAMGACGSPACRPLTAGRCAISAVNVGVPSGGRYRVEGSRRYYEIVVTSEKLMAPPG